jgi:hypothetical protein
MTELPWWKRWPEVLEGEEAAFRAAGFLAQKDVAAEANGVMRYALKVPTSVGELELQVVYPDEYPYFRCQVYAPALSLGVHQNPFEKNLCLIGRRTHFWNNKDDSAAELISRQLETVLRIASASPTEDVAGLEEQQGEPFSDYYKYDPAMLLVQSDWTVPTSHKHGTLQIATLASTEQLPHSLIRGAVLAVRGEDGSVLCEGPRSLRQAFSGKEFEGKWVRVPRPVAISNPGEMIQHLINTYPAMRDARSTHVQDGWLRLWGVLFPEEVGYRRTKDGWVFACAVDKNKPPVPKPHIHAFNARKRKGRR